MNRREVLPAIGLLLAGAGCSRPEPEPGRTAFDAKDDIVKLTQGSKVVVLTLTPAYLPNWGKWERVVASSNAKLQWESGLWENNLTLGPADNARLYDSKKQKFATLAKYIPANKTGAGFLEIGDTNGDFQDEAFTWARL